MKKITLLFLFLFTLSLSAQDIMRTLDKEEISAKIEEILIETISYRKFDNLSGPLYHIKKSEVSEIVFENGSVEVFEKHSIKSDSESTEITLEETELFLVEYLSTYCYDYNGYLRNSYKAKIEGDYLRLILFNKDKTKEIKSNLYDFKSVYTFRSPDKRDGNLAYLNIHVPVLIHVKKDKWERQKLVISVEGHDKAESIVNALKHYNYLLKNKSKKPDQKF
ncbi:MAG: hypothetical protein ABI295_05495 [Xanthomarina sp.]